MPCCGSKEATSARAGLAEGGKRMYWLASHSGWNSLDGAEGQIMRCFSGLLRDACSYEGGRLRDGISGAVRLCVDWKVFRTNLSAFSAFGTNTWPLEGAILKYSIISARCNG